MEMLRMQCRGCGYYAERKEFKVENNQAYYKQLDDMHRE